MALFVEPIPLNTYSWTLGWIVVTAFAYKSYRNYRITRNPLAKYYAIIAALMGTCFFFFGIPNALNNNPSTLLYTYYIADTFAQLGMLAQSRLLWFIGFKNRIPWAAIAIPTAFLSLTIMFFEIKGAPSHVAIDTGANLVRYVDEPITNYLKSLIYLIIAYPIGYFFIRQGFRPAPAKAKLISIGAGFVFLLIATSSIQNALMTSGSDTRGTIIQNLFVFGLFQLISSGVSFYQRKQAKLSQKSFQPQP